MHITYFAVVFGVASLLVSMDKLIHLLMISCLFGAGAAISLPALGGTAIVPSVFCMGFVVLRVIGERGVGQFLSPLACPKAGFWLLLAVTWGIMSAVLLPQLFAGEVMIRTIDRGAKSLATVLTELRPVSGNLTQSVYALGNLATFAAVTAWMASQARLERFADAVLTLGALNCLAAAMHLGELYLGLPSPLHLLRNGSYALFTGGNLGGLQRLSGTFSEPAAFSAFTLPVFAFAFQLWLHNRRAALAGFVALGSLLLLLLSTSATAYVGLAAYLAMVAAGLGWTWLSRGRIPKAMSLTLGASVALLLCLSLATLKPALVGRVVHFFDVTLFNKLQSGSGVERGNWNRQAWSNFIDTFGIGVGLGTARASSFLLVLVSNIGAAGTLLYALFLSKAWRRAPRETHGAEPAALIRRAASQATVAGFAAACVSNASFDMGVAFYAFAATACLPARQESFPARTSSRMASDRRVKREAYVIG